MLQSHSSSTITSQTIQQSIATAPTPNQLLQPNVQANVQAHVQMPVNMSQNTVQNVIERASVESDQQPVQFQPGTLMVSYEQLQSLLTNKTSSPIYNLLQPNTAVRQQTASVQNVTQTAQNVTVPNTAQGNVLPNIIPNTQQAISLLLSSFQQQSAQQNSGNQSSVNNQLTPAQLAALQEQLQNPRRASTGSMPLNTGNKSWCNIYGFASKPHNSILLNIQESWKTDLNASSFYCVYVNKLRFNRLLML